MNVFTVSQAAGIQASPDIAFGNGLYITVWSDDRAGTGRDRIYASRVTTSGTVMDIGGIMIGPLDTLTQQSPSIEFNGSDFFCVWANKLAPSRLMGRFIDETGTLGDTATICSVSPKSTNFRLAYSGSNYLATWVDVITNPARAWGQIIALNGHPVGGPFEIATQMRWLAMCFDGYQYIVTYELLVGSVMETWGKKISVDGTQISSAFRITTSANSQNYCDLVAGANNRYFNVWSERIGTGDDLHGNIDILITGVGEGDRRPPVQRPWFTTVTAAPLRGSAGEKIFDALGRRVSNPASAPGIYFVETSGAVKRKVLVVR